MALVHDWEARRSALMQGRRLRTLAVAIIGSLLLWVSLDVSGVFKATLDTGTMDRVGGFLDRLFPELRAEALLAGRKTEGSLGYWFYDWERWMRALKETAQMAIVGTVVGAAIALLLAFLAASNVMPLAPLRFAVRRFFDVLRTFPDEILAVILTAAFGFGALSGSITLIITTVGSLGKLFSEGIETADPRPVEAIRASGGGVLSQLRYGVMPQVLPVLASYGLLRLEMNLTVAAALGIVGAGGIGVELQRAITYTEFETYLAILILMVLWIFAVDMLSQFIRNRMTGVEKTGAERTDRRRKPA